MKKRLVMAISASAVAIIPNVSHSATTSKYNIASSQSRSFTNSGTSTKNYTDTTGSYNYAYVDENGDIVNKTFTYDTIEKIAPNTNWMAATGGENGYEYALTSTSDAWAQGGIIKNAGTLTVDNVVFHNNGLDVQVNTTSSYSSVAGNGSAIYSTGTVTKINGDFIGNYTKAKMDSTVSLSNNQDVFGAVYVTGTVTNGISGNFIGNTVEFDGNYPNKIPDYSTHVTTGAAAIYSMVKNVDINGTFIENTVTSNSGYIRGGAVVVLGTGSKVKGLFLNNKIVSDGIYAYGGAFYAQANNTQVEADFIGNSITSTGGAQGGAINTESTITSIKGNFINNYVYSPNSGTAGGAIGFNNGNINYLEGTFYGNYVLSDASSVRGGAIFVNSTGSLPNVKADFIQNYAKGTSASGGAIYVSGKYVDIEGNLINNHAISTTGDAKGGAIYYGQINVYQDKISSSIVYGNYVHSDSGKAYGGAIYREYRQKSLIITNSSFINNLAESDSNDARGGAIYSIGSIDIIADNYTSLFSGNKANNVNEAIYMKTSGGYASPTLSLEAKNNGVITFNDIIDGDLGYKVLLKGDASGTININNEIKNAELISGETVEVLQLSPGAYTGINTTNILKGEYLNANNSLIMNSGQVNIKDLGSTSLRFNELTLNGGALNIENSGVDLVAKTMGGIYAQTYNPGNSVVNVENVDVKHDSLESSSVNVNFTDNIIGSSVVNKVTQTYGPVYDYDVDYDPITGNFTFTRSGGFNPQVETSAVAAIASASVLSDEIYSRVLADIDGLHEDRSSVVCNRGVGRAWVKTFGSDETIDLKNFSGVDSEFYGLIAGIESGRINEGKGWNAVYNAYAAYAYGEQKFAGEKVEQRGGYLGASATFYKGDFFAGATANVGTLRNKGKTVDGDDKFNSYLGGVGIKVGYNYKVLKDLILQPNIYGSYTYVNVNDYTTEKGAKVKFSDMHNIEIAPGVKLAKDFGEDARGYIKARYVFNFNEGQDATANGIDIPELEIKDYVEYGVGFEKLWANYDISAFIELMRRDGGREGWAATAGIKWNF